MGSNGSRETAGLIVGAVATVVPALIVSGFMPGWNLLPLGAWLGIAGAGGAIGGTIAAPRPVPGLVAGAVTAAGALLGVVGYVFVRSLISDSFLNLEIAIGALVGAAPGLILFMKWARA
jgi:hypothetical protein